ncbi:MAG: TetR/AcrR family transcriptional regulator [Myxococcales bacterium]|nr:MAG: TetR/AcrR family transcriptional regulator [Myxococcales bacterium]
MSKGEETRDRIVDRAFRLASRDGLSGLSIGKLATELGLSKSGLFAHFGSKEGLELEVLKAGAERFTEQVLRSSFSAPRGVPRLRKLFRNWLAWVTDPAQPGGCVLFAAAAELDDSEGPQRDFLATSQAALMAALAKAARMGVESGELRQDLDCEQFAFELQGILMAYHHSRRLLRDPKAEARAKSAFERLLQTSAMS